MLLAKILKNETPKDAPRVIDPLTRVTKENAQEWAKKWDKWLGK
jgi:ribose transport system substrate-binding protein